MGSEYKIFYILKYLIIYYFSRKRERKRKKERKRERERERERARGVYYSLLASSHGWRYSSFGDGATVS